MFLEKERDFIIEVIKTAYYTFDHGAVNIEQKSSFDVVTNVDYDIEKFISTRIKEEFPTDNILGEEFSNSNLFVGRTWTIDPIDGTCNYASGINLYGIQCSLVIENEICLAAMFIPIFDELIYAVKGEGCYCNGERVYAKNTENLKNVILSFGDYPHKNTSSLADIQHSAIKELYPKIAKIRMFGAACIDFAFVACGKTDGTVVITTNAWDIYPGMLLCREAGATVTNLNGKDHKSGDTGVIAASTKELTVLISNAFKKEFELSINGKRAGYKACIFDLDGVILDTETNHYLAWKEAFSIFKYDLTTKEYSALKSTGRKNILSFLEKTTGKQLSNEEEALFFDKKDKTYEELISQVDGTDIVFSGVRTVLKQLKNSYVKTAVASSSINARMLLNEYALEQYFDVIIDGTSSLPKKPNPDIFLECADMLGLQPDECLVFEDSLVGVEAAKKAGMDVISVGDLDTDLSSISVKNLLELWENYLP